jgi:hypothetical protein
MEEQFFKYFREYIQNNKNKDCGLFETTNNAILYSMEKLGYLTVCKNIEKHEKYS